MNEPRRVWGATAVWAARMAGRLPASLTPAELVVLTVYAQHGGPTGRAWPALSTVARLGGMSVSSARRAVAALVGHGLLVVAEPATARRPATYAVHVPEPSHGETSHGETSHGETPGVSRSHPRGLSLTPDQIMIRSDNREETAHAVVAPGSDPRGDEQAPLALAVDEPPRADDVARVWAAYLDGWRRARGRGVEPRLTDARRRRTRQRIAEHGVEAVVRAATGIWCSRWHLDQGQVGFDLVVRDAGHVEQFAALAPARPRPRPALVRPAETDPPRPTLAPPETAAAAASIRALLAGAAS